MPALAIGACAPLPARPAASSARPEGVKRCLTRADISDAELVALFEPMFSILESGLPVERKLQNAFENMQNTAFGKVNLLDENAKFKLVVFSLVAANIIAAMEFIHDSNKEALIRERGRNFEMAVLRLGYGISNAAEFDRRNVGTYWRSENRGLQLFIRGILAIGIALGTSARQNASALHTLDFQNIRESAYYETLMRFLATCKEVLDSKGIRHPEERVRTNGSI